MDDTVIGLRRRMAETLGGQGADRLGIAKVSKPVRLTDAGQRTGRQFVFYLCPNFSMIAFANALEPLRLANRHLGRPFYRWRVTCANGDSEVASNGVTVKVDHALGEERRLSAMTRPDFVFVCAGLHVERFDTRAVRPWLRQLHSAGVAIGGLCTGSWVLAEAGLLDGERCSIHWETLPSFAERFPEASVYADLYEVSNNIYTCPGGTASLDLMLAIIQADHDETVVMRICEQCLADRVRASGDRQRLPLRARLGLNNAKLMSIIELMEANVEDPLTLVEIASFVGLSRRQVERLFRQGVGMSPARYYLQIRLERARHLLMQSSLPIVDVAVACGFVSASHFSKCFREEYGQSPLSARMERDREGVAA